MKNLPPTRIEIPVTPPSKKWFGIMKPLNAYEQQNLLQKNVYNREEKKQKSTSS